MRRWTREEDAILRECASMGAMECRRELRRRLRASRSVSAVKARAQRLGVSLVRFETCPRCGRKVRRVRPDGLCEPCHQRRLAERQKARNRELMDEISKGEADAEDESQRARREYAAARQEAVRLRRRNGE